MFEQIEQSTKENKFICAIVHSTSSSMMKGIHSVFLVIFFLFIQRNTVFSLKKNSEPKISSFCPEEGTMVIKGYEVKLSDFVRTNGDIYNLCNHKIDLKVVKVFSSYSIVIDRDVDVAGSHFKLFFIAPKWEVIGDRRIAVDGTIGKYMPRASGGNSRNTTGVDGEPGDPGGPGGNFFGSGDTFVDGHRLVITANGGVGGSGQYGGNGYDQEIARHVDVSALGMIPCGMYYDICRGKEKKYQLNLLDNHGNYSDFVCQGLYEKGNMESCAFKMFGREGDEGGRGGHGGRGGMGGLPGSIKLVALNNDSHISTYGISGRRGTDGGGGVGGKSGPYGHNFIYTNLFFLSPPMIELERGQVTFHRLGPNGSDGYNSAGYIEDLVEPDVLEQSEIEQVIAEHKKWLSTL